MSECFDSFPIALGLQTRSPLALPLNRKIQSLKEAGLIEKWQKDGKESAGKHVERGKSLKETRYFNIICLLSMVYFHGVSFLQHFAVQHHIRDSFPQYLSM